MTSYSLKHRETVPRQTSGNGFTLIELSIVLMVVGLIMGGILVGASMKRSAAIQNLIGDTAKYISAAQQFKEKYGYPPGDFPNAASYWGQSIYIGGSATATPTTLTNGGNGDGFIEGEASVRSQPQLWEAYTAWQQLADAGYIQGIYTGTSGTYCYIQDVAGVNTPATQLGLGNYAWDYQISQNEFWDIGGKAYQQYLTIGDGSGATTCNPNMGPILSTGEAQSIDSKVDDGYPGSGKWISMDLGPCVTTNSSGTPVYNSTVQSYFTATNVGMGFACAFAVEVDW